MKKFLSIVLCLAMVLALSAAVSAADNEGTNVVIGENEIVVPQYHPGEWGRLYTSFTAEVTGTYTFTCTSEDGAVGLSDPNSSQIPRWLFNGESYEMLLSAGDYVTVCVYSPHRNDYDYGVTFTLTLTGAVGGDDVNKPEVELVLGENDVYISSEHAVEGLLCAFTAETAGTYLLTVTDDNAYILCGNQELTANGDTAEFTLVAGQYQEVLIGTYDMLPDNISFTISVLSAANSVLAEGDNHIYVPTNRAEYGLECTFTASVGGIYLFTVNDENGFVFAESWLRDGEAREISLHPGEVIDVDVATLDGYSDTISLNITLVREHQYETVVTPPSCNRQGYTTHTCSVCGDYYESDYVSSTGEHAYLTETERKDATCTEDGYVIMACTCGETETTVLPAGHVNGEAVKENEVIGSCTVDAAYDLVVYCELCGQEQSRQTVTTPAPGHTEGEAVKENEVIGDCTTDASYDLAVYCQVCGQELSRQTMTTPAPGHTKGQPVEENVTEATCETAGAYDSVVYCTVCGEEVSRVTHAIPASGHEKSEAVRENEVIGSCTADASYDLVVSCKICGDELSRETVTVTAPGHVEGAAVKENEIPASCSQNGSYDLVVYCQVCGAELSRESKTVVATGDHVYATQTERRDPTCTEDGYVIMACGCGATETTVLPAQGHVPAEAVKENAFAGSCTADATHELAVYCASCGAELSRQTVTVPAPGHTEGEVVKENAVAGDCTTDAAYDLAVYCTVCGAELSRQTVTTPAPGHTEGAAVKENEVKGSCTADASYDLAVYCQVCGEELSREAVTVSAPGHTEGEAVKENVIPASCGTNGSYDLVVYCQVCGAELSREEKTVIATGEHVFATETQRQEPTCTEAGYVVMACGCGETETTVLPAQGHVPAEAVKENEVAAGCATDGTYDLVVKCAACGEELSRETVAVAAIGHTQGEAVKENEIAATCGTDGSYELVIRCTACGEELSRETVIVPTTGEHVYAAETERVEATCTKEGYVIMACGCGETQTTVLPVIDHTAGAAAKENEVAATCTADGSYDSVTYCTGCNAELSRETVAVAATGHSFGQWETVKEPTATEEGSRKRVCACGEEETEVIPALGEDETQPTTAPATVPTTAPATNPTTQPATQPGNTDNDGGDLTVIIIIAVVVAAIAVVAFLVIRKKK